MRERHTAIKLASRLREPRGFIQIVIGPRQTGKTTAIKQALNKLKIPSRYASADGIVVPHLAWVEMEWQQARYLVRDGKPAVLVLDEIQKVHGWADVVKRLWDEDTWNELPLLVVLSGSSTLLLRKGCSESLAGRFELIRSLHWSLDEMADSFGYTLDDYLMFGGYPGAARLHRDAERWAEYMRDSIVEATLSRDVLEMEEVRKPALLRGIFLLGAQYSGQELSYRKMLGQMDDRGNTATAAHYLELLSQAGLLSGIKKYAPKPLQSNASSPKLMVHDPSLVTSVWQGDRAALLSGADLRGRLVESAVGLRLIARSQLEGFSIHWWREGNREVDFVLAKGADLVAVEVKSGRVKDLRGMAAFCERHPNARPMLIGDMNHPVEDFLASHDPIFG